MSGSVPWTIIALCWSAGVAAAQQPAAMSREELNSFTRNYYQNPQPERVPQAIAALGTTGFLDNANRIPPTVAFFGEIFGANPELLPAWKKVIALQDPKTRETLEAAMEVGSDPGVLGFTDQAAWMNDMYWGAFFASGRREFLDRLIDMTMLWEERTSRDLFLTGATALWSLAGNARTHEKVRLAIEAARTGADASKDARLALALTDPAKIRDQMREIMKQQADAGKW